jgi:hypothetical protein
VRNLVALGLWALPAAAGAVSPPWVMGQASRAAGSAFLDIQVTAGCPRGDLIQVVAVDVGAAGAQITAVDSGGKNHYQSGGGSWKGPLTKGEFLATTSPQFPTNFGLQAGAVITLTYSNANVWKGAIAECVPSVESRTGSADNTAGSSPEHGEGTVITLTPSSDLLSQNEPLFVATVLQGDQSDGWTESAGYKTLSILYGDNTLVLAYQFIAGERPTPYQAVNGASRVWSASNRSYKTSPPP